MDLHILTPHGAVLVAQVVDGKVIVPPEPAAKEARKDFENTVVSDCFI